MTTVNQTVCKAVAADELEDYTRNGWRRVESFEQDIEARSGGLCENGYDQNGSPYMRFTPENLIALRKRYYLLEETVEVDREAKIRELTAKLAEVEQAAEKEVKALRAEIETLENRAKNFEQLASDRHERIFECEGRIQRLEDHLGRVRNDIGEREFNRIIGEKS